MAFTFGRLSRSRSAGPGSVFISPPPHTHHTHTPHTHHPQPVCLAFLVHSASGGRSPLFTDPQKAVGSQHNHHSAVHPLPRTLALSPPSLLSLLNHPHTPGSRRYRRHRRRPPAQQRASHVPRRRLRPAQARQVCHGALAHGLWPGPLCPAQQGQQGQEPLLLALFHLDGPCPRRNVARPYHPYRTHVATCSTLEPTRTPRRRSPSRCT